MTKSFSIMFMFLKKSLFHWSVFIVGFLCLNFIFFVYDHCCFLCSAAFGLHFSSVPFPLHGSLGYFNFFFFFCFLLFLYYYKISFINHCYISHRFFKSYVSIFFWLEIFSDLLFDIFFDPFTFVIPFRLVSKCFYFPHFFINYFLVSQCFVC